MTTSQNGWPADASRRTIGVVGLNIDGVDIVGGVKSGDVYTVLRYVALQFHRRVEPLINPGCWGHAFRVIAGTRVTSNHGSGTAIDLNAPKHGRGVKNTFSSKQVAEIKKILSEVGGVVTWGGTWTNPDDMHFEINTTADKVAAVAAKLTADPVSPTTHPTLKQGSRGPDVALVQRYLGISADGVFGPATDAAVRGYQVKQKLFADGVVGPATWARIDSGLGRESDVPVPGGPAPITHATLRPGATGEEVKLVQRWLGVPADGIFGPATERAVMRYQRMRQLVADGVVGPKTWAAMGV